MRYIFFIAGIIWTTGLPAQADSARLDTRFAFADGLYGSLAAVQANRPDWRWDELAAEVAVNPQSLLARLASPRRRDNGQALPVDSIWGFAREGMLYRRLRELPPEGEAFLFAGIWEKGRICLYSYEREVTRMVEMKAYIPQTGRPFRTGRVSRTEVVETIVMLDFRSGRATEINRADLLDWVRKDDVIYEPASRMSPEEIDLVRVVQAFNDRNPVNVPKGQP